MQSLRFCPLSDQITQTLPIAPPELLPNHVETLIKEVRDQARGKGQKRSIRVRERRGRQRLTEREKIETEMMSETVVERRRMMLLLQAAREDAASAGVEKSTRLALRYPRQ